MNADGYLSESTFAGPVVDWISMPAQWKRRAERTQAGGTSGMARTRRDDENGATAAAAAAAASRRRRSFLPARPIRFSISRPHQQTTTKDEKPKKKEKRKKKTKKKRYGPAGNFIRRDL